ncbi:MAG: ribosome biogenesis GTPase Der [Fusobacteriota bacterium]
MKPLVAIVGRPNVGKSTLFNKIVRERASIVENVPGVTRDRLYRDTEWLDQEFVLIDTGGIKPDTNDYIQKRVAYQAELAMEEADVILFVVDGRAGITALDESIAKILRRKQKHIIVTVNKIDNFESQQDLMYEFYGLGFENIVPVSAEHKKNLGDLLDEVAEEISKIKFPEEEEGLKISIIGRPNVGKSSLANKFLDKERNIVSDVAGTTRDAIDSSLEYDGQKYILIDTAGIRRKSKVTENIEYYSVLRAIKAIKRADVCFLMIDAQEGVTAQDKRIAGLAHDEHKPVVIVVNKWDLIEKDGETMKRYKEEYRRDLKFLQFSPYYFVSALTGKRAMSLLPESKYLYEEYHKHISTGLLNEILQEALIMNPPTTRKGRAIKIKYMTQSKQAPPKFIIFGKNVELLHFSYLRYLENAIREAFGFDGCPIEFVVREQS